MRKVLTILLCVVMSVVMLPIYAGASAEDVSQDIPEGHGCEKRKMITNEDGKYRLIITSDAEVDDFNSFLNLLLFANDFDIEGVIYSSSWCHWNGDGEHTQGEINPSINSLDKCMEQVGEEAVNLKEFRPMDLDWFQNVIDNYYRTDYEYLVQNDPRFPEPDDLLSTVKIGNVEFQGDVRFDTEGSDLIKDAILKDDERQLIIVNWGGFNTTCRALLSIYEEYGQEPDWAEMEKQIGEKLLVTGFYQDNSYDDNHIAEIYPDVHQYHGTGLNLGYYRSNSAPERFRDYFKAEQMCEHFIFDHGEIMGHQYTFGDGQILKGELDMFQFGLRLDAPNMQDRTFEKYDHLAWTDTPSWVTYTNVGLRGLENPNLGTWAGRVKVDLVEQNRIKDYTEYDEYDKKERATYSGIRFMGDLLDEFVARADWAARPYEECNHAPVVTAENLDLTASAGDTVSMKVELSDPDENSMNVNWFVYNRACEYYGAERDTLTVESEDVVLTETSSENAVTIPEDAMPGDYIVVICRVQDDSFAPMTRYAEFVIEIQ